MFFFLHYHIIEKSTHSKSWRLCGRAVRSFITRGGARNIFSRRAGRARANIICKMVYVCVVFECTVKYVLRAWSAVVVNSKLNGNDLCAATYTRRIASFEYFFFIYL